MTNGSGSRLPRMLVVATVVVLLVVGAAVAMAVLERRGSPGGRTNAPLPDVSPPPGDSVRVVAAGDICPASPSGCERTASLAERLAPDAVLTLGDNQYPDGTFEQYMNSYDHAWGRFRDITFPVAGNHEWHTGNADGFLQYFGRSTHWYSYSLGRWRVYALDGTCDENGGCEPGDPQHEWLRDQLAGRSDRCVLAYWHQPRFSSGSHHGSDDSVAPLWELLEAADADVVLNGHEHNYERFAPQGADGRPRGGGIVQFVVGTGGAGSYGFGDPLPASEVRLGGAGVLDLKLFDDGWVADFVRPSGEVADRAEGGC